MIRTRSFLLALGLVSLLGVAPAHAQDFPTRPVRLITSFPAGAGPEVVLRLLADKLQKKWGKPVYVENRPGGNGFIAIDAFRRGAHDGHDLILLDNVHLVAYPALFSKLPYDPVRDFEPLLPTLRTPFFVTVGSESRYRSVADIVADARAHPGALNYGSWSIGNPVHLATALLETSTQTQMQHVVYKETSLLYTAVAKGELNFALGSLATTRSMLQAGRLRFVAVTSPKRLPAFPDVPTVAESVGLPCYEMSGWTWIGAPRGLPPAVADKIYKDMAAALAEPDIRARYADLGYEPFPMSREQFQAFVASETVKYTGVIRRARVSLD